MFLTSRIAAIAIVSAAIGYPLFAAEKASEQVNTFYGSFSHAIAIEVPEYKGLEPRLALTYSSEGRNGFAGVGWNLSGISRIERANVGRGTPHFEADDIFMLDGQELVACQPGSASPSCTTGSGSTAGTHSTKNESYLRIRFDAASNTWTVWGKDGTRTVFTPIFEVPPGGYVAGGTLIWGQTSTIDTHNNTVAYSWECPEGDCYPSSISYNGYRITFHREGRTDSLSFAAATIVRRMAYRLRSVIVELGGDPIRGYRLSYSTSALTGRSLLASVQVYGNNLTHNQGAITGGASLPAQTFTYQDDAIGRSFVDWSGTAGGTATEPVTWVNPVNASVTGASYNLTKTGGEDGVWDAGATSTRAITSGSGYLAFTSTDATPQRIVGLSNGSVSSDPNEIDFGIYLTTENKMYVIENGALAGPFSRAEGQELRIAITPTSVTYQRNGETFHEHPASPTYPLLTDTSIRSRNATIAGAVISGTLGYVNGWCQGAAFLTGDFNGDGRTDQLCYTWSLEGGMPSHPRIRVALATATGFASPTTWQTDGLAQGVVGDWNGDGLDDLADRGWDAKVYVLLSTGTSFGPRTLWGDATGLGPDGRLHACNGSLAFAGAGDFNGDGLQDVYCKAVNSDAVHIGLSNGTSALSFRVWAQLRCQSPAEGLDRAVGGIDFDGDGKDDWYCIGVTNGILAVFPSSGSTFLGFVGGALGPDFCRSENYVLGDVNGDGRTDASCTQNGQVALSMGRLWAPTTPEAGLWCNGGQAFPADLDGDGASELVCNNYGDGLHDVQVRKWNGVALGPAETWKPSWCAGNVRAGDWNGDGKVDLHCGSANDSVVAGTGGMQADLTAVVANGLGGTTTVAYTPASAFSNTNAPPPKYTVTSLTVADGRGWSATSTFSYSGGKMDRRERLFLGFQYARQTLPCIDGESACPYAETWFRQDLPALGRVARTVQRDGANNLHGLVDYEYTTNEPALPRRALLTGQRVFSFDGAGCPSWPCSSAKKTYTTHQYDAYGNEVASSFSGDETAPGDETSATRSYPYNPALYIVDRPGTEVALGPAGEELARTEFLYDGAASPSQPPTRGNVTKVRRWLAEQSRWVEAESQYDNWGNPTHVWDETDRLTTTVFDPLHHEFPISVTTAAGETETVVWDAVCGSPSMYTDENQQVTRFHTDPLCRPRRTDFPLGHYEERDYLDLGAPGDQRTVVSAPSPTGGGPAQRAIAYFDGLGRTYRSLAQAGGGDGAPIEGDTTFNPRGQVATVTAPRHPASRHGRRRISTTTWTV